LPVPDPVQLEDFCAATAAGRLGNPAKIQGHLAGGEQIVPCVASARKSFHPGDWFLGTDLQIAALGRVSDASSFLQLRT